MSARRGSRVGLAMAAAGLMVGEDAVPTIGCAVRLSYVAGADRGARDALWPDTPILVQPCDGFMGAGYYQLLTHAGVVVRRCFQAGSDMISVVDRSLAGGPSIVAMTPKAFSDEVCGLVVAQLGILNAELAAEMLAQRQVLA